MPLSFVVDPNNHRRTDARLRAADAGIFRAAVSRAATSGARRPGCWSIWPRCSPVEEAMLRVFLTIVLPLLAADRALSAVGQHLGADARGRRDPMDGDAVDLARRRRCGAVGDRALRRDRPFRHAAGGGLRAAALGGRPTSYPVTSNRSRADDRCWRSALRIDAAALDGRAGDARPCSAALAAAGSRRGLSAARSATRCSGGRSATSTSPPRHRPSG